jgi:uncharacterized protein YjbI with pentapeptide repeats
MSTKNIIKVTQKDLDRYVKWKENANTEHDLIKLLDTFEKYSKVQNNYNPFCADVTVVMSGERLKNSFILLKEYKNVDFTGIEMENIRVENIKFTNCKFSNCNINKMIMTDCHLENCEFNKTILDNSLMEVCNIKECKFIGASLNNVVITGRGILQQLKKDMVGLVKCTVVELSLEFITSMASMSLELGGLGAFLLLPCIIIISVLMLACYFLLILIMLAVIGIKYLINNLNKETKIDKCDFSRTRMDHCSISRTIVTNSSFKDAHIYESKIDEKSSNFLNALSKEKEL